MDVDGWTGWVKREAEVIPGISLREPCVFLSLRNVLAVGPGVLAPGRVSSSLERASVRLPPASLGPSYHDPFSDSVLSQGTEVRSQEVSTC